MGEHLYGHGDTETAVGNYAPIACLHVVGIGGSSDRRDHIRIAWRTKPRLSYRSS